MPNEAQNADLKDAGQSLEEFVSHAISRNMDYVTIRHMLRSAGWKDREILAAVAANGLEMPVPSPRRKGGAMDAFFHLSAFTCMYVAAISLMVIVFDMIDLTIPDSVDDFSRSEWIHSSIRSALSFLVVFFPLALVFNWLIRRNLKRTSMLAGSSVERWLTYLTLFVIVMTILCDGSTLIYTLLEGELTARFLAKAFALLAVVGGAFVYLWTGTYQWSNKRNAAFKWSRRWLVIAGTLVVVGVGGWALSSIETPQTLRLKKFDDARISDIRRISTAVDRYYEDHLELPSSLDDLGLDHSQLKDPETEEFYEYIVDDSEHYRLSARFHLAEDDPHDYYGESDWTHGAGVHEFSFAVETP